MNILMVCGIFEPEVGGPATYAPQLALKLKEKGYEVTVVTFSPTASDPEDAKRPYKIVRVKRGNKLLNRLRFFFAARAHMKGVDCIYMLDWFAAGLPAGFAARLRGIPYIVRVGGDYLWEQRYLESGKPPMPLRDFYEKGIYKKYGSLFRIIQRTLSRSAHIIFNSDKQRELYVKYYGLDPRHVSTIYNPALSVANLGESQKNKEIVFWGRFIVMKNLDTLVRAFAKAKLPADYKLTLIGDGPRKKNIIALIAELKIDARVTVLPAMKRSEAFDRVKDCRAYVLPSWTDISPNQVYEALAIGLPALVTKENYLKIADELPSTIDPRSVDDVARKLEMLADDAKYGTFSAAFRKISYSVSWDDVVQAHIALFDQVSKNAAHRRRT